MKAAPSSSAHVPAIHQLAEILGCPPTWNAISKFITKENGKPGDAWVKECFEGIDTILLDDGLNTENDAFNYSWHERLTRSK